MNAYDSSMMIFVVFCKEQPSIGEGTNDGAGCVGVCMFGSLDTYLKLMLEVGVMMDKSSLVYGVKNIVKVDMMMIALPFIIVVIFC
mmetsp:Transcript_27337/g.40429  ORF Transcript_27337/g.40429 Transcript_27337/m.40429 type:complete len:86 (+) Transcript_27337:1392-1649(+)